MRRTRHRADAEEFLRALVAAPTALDAELTTDYGRIAMDPEPDQIVSTIADQVVRLRVDAGIATITLDSQHNRNALSRQLVAELGERLDEIESTAGVRVIVLTNDGPGVLRRRRSEGARRAARPTRHRWSASSNG